MDYAEHVSLPDWHTLNGGLTSPTPRFMVDAVGNPRDGNYSNDCQPPTDEGFKAHLATVDVGPFTVEGHHLYLRALRAGFHQIAQEHPDLMPLLGNAGALCCRWVRGYPGVISNHSFGCAIDMKVSGILVPLGATWCTRGHLVIYEAMHAQRIFWGGGYKHRKDPMHFEASEELVSSWDGSV